VSLVVVRVLDGRGEAEGEMRGMAEGAIVAVFGSCTLECGNTFDKRKAKGRQESWCCKRAEPIATDCSKARGYQQAYFDIKHLLDGAEHALRPTYARHRGIAIRKVFPKVGDSLLDSESFVVSR
jgi:hypothetical protein